MSTLFTQLFGAAQEETKTCSKCKKNLLLVKYSKASGGNYLRSECRYCEKSLGKIRSKLRKENTLPPLDYICPICQRNSEQIKDSGGKKSGGWCCDHDHATNKFRGWLCHNCNRALGNMQDDVSQLQRAIKYLENNFNRS